MPKTCLKEPLILSGLAYKLRSGSLWCRRHTGVQNDANAPSAASAQSHEPYAGHEGTYSASAGSDPIAPHHTTRSTHTLILTYFDILTTPSIPRH